MFDLEEELKKLPAKPGVYLMHDKDDVVIYVGKAINLKNRVRQYFQPSKSVTAKIATMISKIDHFEYIITDSELEAFILECNLIHEHNPKYNTMLKDGKSYPYLLATLNETYPRLLFVRDIKKYNKKGGEQKVKYFGPYTSAGAVKDIIELMIDIYKLRTCSRNLPKDQGKERPCLNYHIHQCLAPCQGYISVQEYRKNFAQILDFLNGNSKPILTMLEDKMKEASEALEFEEAARYRDLIESVNHIMQKQKITSYEQEDRDIIAVAKAGREAVVQVFFIRAGKLIGREHFYMEQVEDETREEVVTAFIKQYYAGTPYIPKELFLQFHLVEEDVICEWLSSKRQQKVNIRVPKKGEKERLVELAQKNASMVLQKDADRIKREEARTIGAVKQIEEWLGLVSIMRMESFDISNISGFQAVGSMVVFEKGKPKRNDYRKFKIKWVQGPDDYGSMREVLTRRFTHGLKEQEEDVSNGKFHIFPDLILMDGGKGQVNIALQVLDELNLHIPVCGMVKDENHRTRGLYYNNIEIPIDSHSEGFQLITRIQDETHRFAIEYHRSLRGKNQVHSVLDEIAGIGDARRKALLRYFKSIEAIQMASVEELKQVAAMNERAAKEVYLFFHPES